MSSPQNNEASKITAIKDQAVGAVKEAIGSALGNNKMQLQGKAQKVHGKNEYEYATAFNSGQTEPEKFQHAYHPQPSPQQDQLPYQQNPAPIPPAPVSNAQPTSESESSQVSGWKDEAVGSVKETFGSATNNPQMEIAGKAQKMHGHNEAEFARANKDGLNEPQHFEHGTKTTQHAQGTVEGENVSTLGAMKDKAMGSLKETVGSMTGNQDMELKGKAQNMHGRNEAEFAKAQKEGLSQPQHFEHGTKITEHAQGTVEGENVSALSAMKDKAVGAVKETFGSATGNMNTELAGKAQLMHGRNEAEFAKAQKQGLNEPEHYAQGTKMTEHAEGQVVSQEPSKMSGWKDEAVGSVKESIGSATGNQKMEIEGKAQKMEGSMRCKIADNRNTINA